MAQTTRNPTHHNGAQKVGVGYLDRHTPPPVMIHGGALRIIPRCFNVNLSHTRPMDSVCWRAGVMFQRVFQRGKHILTLHHLACFPLLFKKQRAPNAADAESFTSQAPMATAAEALRRLVTRRGGRAVLYLKNIKKFLDDAGAFLRTCDTRWREHKTTREITSYAAQRYSSPFLTVDWLGAYSEALRSTRFLWRVRY